MLYNTYQIKKPIRLIELFAGYGSQALALKYLGVNFEHHKICEWATKSIQAYNDIHIRDYTDYSKELTQNDVIELLTSYGVSMDYNKPMTYNQIKCKDEKWQRDTYNNIIATHNLVNIQNAKAKDLNIVDTNKYDYILTYSFPCQDLSLAGKREGMSRGSGTRSGMLWEVERLLKECEELPQILVMENVPQVHGKGNMEYFQEWIMELEKLGYTSFYDDLNSKNFYIPQNRQRTFMISLLGKYNYKMSKTMKSKYRLKDMLEKEVSKKYYLSDKMISYISTPNQKWTGNNNGAFINKDIASTLNTREGSRRCDASNYVCDDLPDNFNLQNECLKIKEKTKKGYFETQDGDGVYINRPEQKRGVVQKGMIQTIKTSPDTLGVVVKDDNIYNLFYTIFDLCCIIDTKEKDKYERSRELLQILWEEIGKKEIWQEIRRFISVQEKKILQSNLYENGIYEDRKLQSRISSSPSNSDKYNESITNREKMFNMWEDWKTRYTPQRWELSKQQFRQFNLFMQELSYETTQGETSVQDMWKADERFRILQQTLFKIQEIWRPIENKISNGLRIRKLSPRECWRLMGVKDEDFKKVNKNQSDSSLYHLAGDSIVTTCLMAIFGELLGVDYKTKINDLVNHIVKND